MPEIEFLPGYALADGRCAVSAFNGDKRGAYVVRARSSMTHHGMAYGARALGSRSRRRSRGSHAPPGSARRSCTRQRAAGNQMNTHREVRKMRNAETILGIKVTGEPLDIERV